jgi:hypothetical protein
MHPLIVYHIIAKDEIIRKCKKDCKELKPCFYACESDFIAKINQCIDLAKYF